MSTPSRPRCFAGGSKHPCGSGRRLTGARRSSGWQKGKRRKTPGGASGRRRSYLPIHGKQSSHPQLMYSTSNPGPAEKDRLKRSLFELGCSGDGSEGDPVGDPPPQLSDAALGSLFKALRSQLTA
eukprot:gene12003-biopygen12451